MIKNPIFTAHALERLKERSDIPLDKVIRKLESSARLRIPFFRSVNKSIKWGTQDGIEYFYSAPLLFTVNCRDPNKSVVITIMKRKKDPKWRFG